MFIPNPFVSFHKSPSHSYDSVPASDEETLLASPNNKEAHDPTTFKRTFFNPSFWLSAFAALSIAITIRNLLVIQLHSREPRFHHTEASIGTPYNGLERLIRNESSPSWPLSSVHYPDFVGATEGTYIRHALSNGSIVRLDSEHTVIIQHRVHDHGLERCAIKLRFSDLAEQTPEHIARGYSHVGDDPHLTLWRTEGWDSKTVLSPTALPMSLPSRKELLGDIALEDMHSAQSPFFGCKAGSILTLEIALSCMSDGPCIVEFPLARPLHQGFWTVQSE